MKIKIGHGSFADVYKAIWVTGDGKNELVAVKKLKSMDGFERIHREITILSRLKHENILSFFKITVEAERPVLLIEYAWGSVYHLLHNKWSEMYSDIDKMRWIYQCANVSILAYPYPLSVSKI